MDGVTIVSHPLVQHKLTLLREKNSRPQSSWLMPNWPRIMTGSLSILPRW